MSRTTLKILRKTKILLHSSQLLLCCPVVVDAVVAEVHESQRLSSFWCQRYKTFIVNDGEAK
jgi:hypothetical protein